jgi:hypothetical protein
MTIDEIDMLLEEGRIGINVAGADETIMSFLAAFNYDGRELDRGRGLREAGQRAQVTQKEERDDMIQARSVMSRVHKQAWQDYMDDLELTRLAHKEPSERWLALGLYGRRARSLTGFLSQASLYYTAALSDEEAQRAMARFGLTVERLLAHQAQLGELERLQEQLYVEAAEAKEATRQRDEALDAFAEWWSDFTRVARIALRSRPDLLAKMGLA